MSAQSTEAFPLYNLLYLYTKSRHHLYINYFEGFKALVRWLEPIEVPALAAPHIKKLPPYFETWELRELSQILHIDIDIIFTILLEIYTEQLYHGPSPETSISLQLSNT